MDRVRLGLIDAATSSGRISDWKAIRAGDGRRVAGAGMVENGSYDVFWGPMLRGKFGEEYYDQVGMAWLWGKIQTQIRVAADKGTGQGEAGLSRSSASARSSRGCWRTSVAEQGGDVSTSPVERGPGSWMDGAALRATARSGGRRLGSRRRR